MHGPVGTPASERRDLARREFGSLTRLALPIIATQLSQMGMGVADTIMAGQVSATDLAGVALGGMLFWPVTLAMSGILLAVTPSVSQLHGAGRESDVGEVVRQALWLALFASLVVVALVTQAELAFRAIGVDARAIPIAVAYLDAMSVGLVPLAGYFTLRYLCEGLSWTTPAMLIAGTGLVLKIPLNWVFIYGHFGVDAMGGAGCGWASAVIMTGELLAMIGIVLFSRVRRIGTFSRFSAPNVHEILRIVKLGVPIAATMFFEMAAFSGAALLIGRLGVESVAAHQIAGNVNGLTFMIPLALGTAATIRVGYNVGAGDLVRARIAGRVALAASVLFAAAAAVILLAARHSIAALFTSDVAVAAIAADLMLFVAFYQFFDDAQATAIGTLRGYKDTRVPMLVALVVYWGVMLPLGAVLGFGLLGLPALGVDGFWWGFTVGLGLVALSMSARMWWLGRQPERILLFARR
jgi:MATE family multidrug resistance protein